MDFSSLPVSPGIALESSVESLKMHSNIETTDQQSSKHSSSEENKYFDTSSIYNSSKTCTNITAEEVISSEVEDAVANALSLLYQLKDAVSHIPLPSQNRKFDNHPTTSSASSTEKSIAAEIEDLRKQNEEIEKDLENKQQQLIQLSSQYEEATELLKKKTEECNALKASLQPSFSSVDESQTDVSISTVEESFSTPLASSSEIFSHMSYAPQSLPVFTTNTETEEELQQKIANLQKEVLSYRSKIQKLMDMNAQWEQYNGEKELIVKRLEENVQKQQLEIDHLKRQIDTADTNPKSVTFSPAQQTFIDNAYQRLRVEADRYRDQQETTALETRRVVGQARQKQEETERKSVELQKRIAELESRARAQTQRQEELQTALLVATRSSQQTSREQELISSLREAARQYENDYQRISEDHRNALRENNLLKDELASLTQRRNVQHTIVSQHAGGTTTMTRSAGNFSIRNEPRNVPGGDIEIDEWNQL